MRHILIYLAFSLSILHSVVPHHHDDEVVDVEIIDVSWLDELLDGLQDLFHIDMGEDHLENYQVTDDDLQLASSWMAVLPPFLFIDSFSVELRCQETSIRPPDWGESALYTPILLVSDPLRGPPAHVI